MIASRLSPHPAGGFGQRVRGVLGLAPRGVGARFAADQPPQPAPEPQPAAAAAPQESPQPAHRHPVHKPHRNNTPLIFIGVTACAIVAFIVVLVVMRSRLPTYDEVHGKLTIAAPDGKRAYATLARDEFRQVVSVEPERDESDPTGTAPSLYFYLKVQGGRAEIVVERDAWNKGQAKVKSVQLFRR